MNQVHPRRMISPQLLAQQQDIFSCLPWLTDAMQFYQLQSNIKFPSLQGFLQSGRGIPTPLHPLFHPP